MPSSKSLTDEPLLNLIVERWRLHPSKVFMILFIVGLVDELGVGFLLGYWKSTPGVVGVFDINNIPLLLMSLIVEPSIWAFYAWLPFIVSKLSDDIHGEKVILDNRNKFSNEIQKLNSFIASKKYTSLALIIVLCLAFFSSYVISQYRPIPWFFFSKWHFILLGLPRLLAVMYVTVGSVLYTVRVMVILYQTFREVKVRVTPYHEDNAGGLGMIGRSVLALSRLSLILVPFLVGEVFFALRLGKGIFGQYNILFEFVTLPVLSLIIFMLPLLSCRQAMIIAREDQIRQIAEKIYVYSSELINKKVIVKGDVETLSALIDFRLRLMKDFPTLPFDISIARGLGVGFVLSLVPTILSIIIQVTNLMNR
jgi:hypothetical protein